MDFRLKIILILDWVSVILKSIGRGRGGEVQSLHWICVFLVMRVTFPSSFPQNGFLPWSSTITNTNKWYLCNGVSFVATLKPRQVWPTQCIKYMVQSLLSLNGFTATNCTFYNENKRLASARETQGDRENLPQNIDNLSRTGTCQQSPELQLITFN